ncbi:MAG TPA: acyltransferase [Methylomirabilota bacterium]|jgi:peptidoglycan/LPS O-acetylase OafA/YrhL|nr:acyltransferase [Methylomirabilota bacterium]
MALGSGRSERIGQLRGVAALAVVACHLGVSAYVDAPNAGGSPWPWLGLVLGFGYLGVPLFFVISGFCIHLPQARLLADPAARPFPWRRFFARRFWRLYPPYLAALGIAVVLSVVASGGLPVGTRGVMAQALLVHTFHPATFDGVNPPGWSLAVEAQLYAVYPVAFWLIGRHGALRALAAVLALTLGYRAVLTFDPLPVPFGGVAWEFFLARWFEWVLGAVVAEWAVGRVRLPRWATVPWPALALFGLGLLLEWHRWRPGAYALMEPIYGIAFALLLCVILSRERDGEASAVGRYLAGIGLCSYSVYLLHRPIQLAFEPLARQVSAWPSVVEHGIPSSLLIMAATTPVVLWAARTFYRYCEVPSMVRAGREAPSPVNATDTRR